MPTTTTTASRAHRLMRIIARHRREPCTFTRSLLCPLLLCPPLQQQLAKVAGEAVV